MVLLGCLLTPPALWWLARNLPDSRVRRLLGPSLPCLVLALGFLLPRTPAERLLLASLWLLYSLKGWILLRERREWVAGCSGLGLALYLSLWPGMDPAPLRRRDREIAFAGDWFVRGWIHMLAGVVALVTLAVGFPRCTWAGVFALLAIIHLGYSDVLSAVMRGMGFPVRRLFDHPLASRSLTDFWNRRWNRPFVEMNRLLFLRPLARRLGSSGGLLGAFMLSGLLHDYALSFPAGAGWGWPSLYFLLQGTLLWSEPRLNVEGWPEGLARLWTWGWLLGPLPLLFHAPFREQLIGPFLEWLHRMPPLGSFSALLATMLFLAACGHFLILAASFQVPARLGWAEDLSRIRPFNRKLMWVYGGFTVFNIVSFGVLLLQLHEEMLRGDRAAVYLAGYIALFWTLRLVVDAWVFEHDDWPSGPAFVVGHTLLASLFTFLALTAWAVVIAAIM